MGDIMITNNEDLLTVLDDLFEQNRKQNEFWDQLYSDKTKDIPIFTHKPDETLVELINNNKNIISALDIGSGNGRNAIYLAKNDIKTSVLDFSLEALDWVSQNAKNNEVIIDINKADVTKDSLDKKFDLIYDSGCFHHLTPHRRTSYKNFILSHLNKDGIFGLVTFYAGGKMGGYEGSDKSCYENYTLYGGLGYTEEKINNIFYEFEVIGQRRMKKESDKTFGHEDLLFTIMKRIN